jgi:AraC-like DNA-binding protein
MPNLYLMKDRRASHPFQEPAGPVAVVDGKFPLSREDAQSDSARKVEQSVAYMAAHLNEPLCIAQLSATVHVSSSHFFVLFKRWTGFSPIDYFIRLRMKEGGRLLATTSMSVKEIAAELGYDDPFYFSRLFKSVQGMAPSEYRLKQATGEASGPQRA